MSKIVIFSVLLFGTIGIFTECSNKTEYSFSWNIENNTENWNILSFHALDHRAQLTCLEKASSGLATFFPNLVGMSEHLRIGMTEKIGGYWNCFTQIGPINYSVMRRTSIYLKSRLEEKFDNLRIFCFK